MCRPEVKTMWRHLEPTCLKNKHCNEHLCFDMLFKISRLRLILNNISKHKCFVLDKCFIEIMLSFSVGVPNSFWAWPIPSYHFQLYFSAVVDLYTIQTGSFLASSILSEKSSRLWYDSSFHIFTKNKNKV